MTHREKRWGSQGQLKVKPQDPENPTFPSQDFLEKCECKYFISSVFDIWGPRPPKTFALVLWYT